MSRFRAVIYLFCALALFPLGAIRAASPSSEFRPDPAAVQRFGPAYRYPQAGWIVLHIEGDPYDRGYQHGRLLASEITDFLKCFATIQCPKDATGGWRLTRIITNSTFLRGFDREYLEEMQGIADGAASAGARFDNRPIDLVDVAALNVWPEIETLESALEATPTGLEGVRFPNPQGKAMPEPKPEHCSAFAATGPATADGKIVFGHITMFGLYPARFYNVWLDVKPARGHRVLIQGFPAAIQSGMDYYMNDAGIVCCETTIGQTRFNGQGVALASRIRQALQYGDSIDKVVEFLKNANNGLYTNEWLLADTKTNEIAMFELGTAKTRLYRSSKGEWFGGTEGFYWGCNNTKDLDVRLETIAGVNDRPANMVWRPSERDKKWQQLYAAHKGKIDVGFGKLAFTTPPVAAYHSLDAKFTTTDLAKDLKTWALFGPPLGRTWEPTAFEKEQYPEIRPLLSNPWTVLTAEPPQAEGRPVAAADLPDRVTARAATRPVSRRGEFRQRADKPAWHGTLLPRSDADAWLAAAFADYEKIVARQSAAKGDDPDTEPSGRARDHLGLDLFGCRAMYLAGVRAGKDVPLDATHAEAGDDHWYRVADGKGVLLLHQLRGQLGDRTFREVMDSFGREHAGQQVSTEQFRVHVEKAAGKNLDAFFDYWLKQTGLPGVRLGKVRVSEPKEVSKEGSASTPEWAVEGELLREGHGLSAVDVTVETAHAETSALVNLDGDRPTFRLTVRGRPKRVVVDKYNKAGCLNGGAFSVLSFFGELENALIVYGTADEKAANREAAHALARAVREHGTNFTLAIKADDHVTDEDLRDRHVLLVGRPGCNRVTERFRKALPVAFGPQSFAVDGETYAHAGSAVVAAAANPINARYSVVVFAGNDSESTLTVAVPGLFRSAGRGAGEVLLLAHGKPPRMLVLPDRDLVYEVKDR